MQGTGQLTKPGCGFLNGPGDRAWHWQAAAARSQVPLGARSQRRKRRDRAKHYRVATMVNYRENSSAAMGRPSQSTHTALWTCDECGAPPPATAQEGTAQSVSSAAQHDPTGRLAERSGVIVNRDGLEACSSSFVLVHIDVELYA